MSKSIIDLTKGCPLLDYQVSIDTDGMLYPCCHTTNYKFDNIEKLRKWQKKQKKEFLKNKWPDPCFICKTREKNAGYSTRIYSHRLYDYNPKLTLPKIKDLQVAYKNLCNLSCIMCDVSSSSTIYEYLQINKSVPVNWQWNKKKHVNGNENNLQFILDSASSLENVTLIGGEPFLIKEYLVILNHLSVNCNILIVSNGTVYNQNFIEACKKFKKIYIGFSIDGYGTVNEALRLNSKWNVVEKNILHIKSELPNAIIGLCPTWTCFNIFHWKSLYDWAIKNKIYDYNSFWQNVITTPDHLRLCYVKDSWKGIILNNCNNKQIYNKLLAWFNEPKNEEIEIVKEQWQLLKNIGYDKGFDYEKIFPHIYNND